MDRVDCVVIGAGVVGLAVARKLAQAGREVIVLEEAEAIGTVTSRNAGKINEKVFKMSSSGTPRLTTSSTSFKMRAISNTKVKTARPKKNGTRISRNT